MGNPAGERKKKREKRRKKHESRLFAKAVASGEIVIEAPKPRVPKAAPVAAL